METLPAVGTEIICLGVMVMVRVGVRVRVRVSSLRDSFSVLLRPYHHSMLTTAGRVSTSKQ